MPITDLFSLACININTVGAGDIVLDQIKDQSVQARVTEFLDYGDGVIDPSIAAILSQDPILRATTGGIAKALAKVAMSGLEITADEDEPGVEFYLVKRAKTGGAASGSVHEKHVLTQGVIVPTTIDASLDGAAMSMEFHAESSDGITSPYGTPSQAAYALSQGTAEAFVVGPAKIDSITVQGVKRCTYNFGLGVIKEWADGDPFPTWCGINMRRPVITIETVDATVLRTIGIGGHSITSSAVSYLRKVSPGGTRVADGTEEHISFSAAGGLVVVTDVSAQHQREIQPAVARIDIYPHKTVGADLLVIDTTAAISLS